MPALFEVERTASRGDVATLLRAIAAGVESGTVTLEADGDQIGVDVPAEVEYELELETASEGESDAEPVDGEEETGDDPSGDEVVPVELEVELEWDAGPETGVEIPPAHYEAEDESGGDDGEAVDESHDEVGAEGEDAGAAEADSLRQPTPTDGVPVQQVDAGGSAARFELFRDRADEWRWRLVHDNGNIIADSGEGYTRKETARKGLASVRANAADAAVVEVSTEE